MKTTCAVLAILLTLLLPGKNSNSALTLQQDQSQEIPLGEIQVRYDKFKDATIVNVLPPSSDSPRPAFCPTGWYKGKKKRRAPSEVQLDFVSKSSDWVYLKCHDVHILADGKKVYLLEDATDDSDVGDGYVLEQINASVDWLNAKKIALARKVEVEICNTNFELTRPELNLFRRFLNFLSPHPLPTENDVPDQKMPKGLPGYQ